MRSRTIFQSAGSLVGLQHSAGSLGDLASNAKGFNKLLGSVVGAFKGIFVVAIVSIILGLVAMVIPETPFAQALEGSVIHGIVSDAVHVIFGN